MDFGESIFLKFWNSAKSLSGNRPTPKSSNCVYLDDISLRLTILARALTKKPINIRPAELEGGASGDDFYLPQYCDRYGCKLNNTNFYIFRTVYLSISIGFQKKTPFSPSSLEEARKYTFELSAIVLPIIKREFSPFWESFKKLFLVEENKNQDLQNWFWLWGKFLTPNKKVGSILPEKNSQLDVEELEDSKEIKTEIEGVIRDSVDVADIDHIQIEDYTLCHNFEKCLTADDFNGNWRDFDGDDEAKDHEEALKEIKMDQIVRVNETVHSVTKSQLRLISTQTELSDDEKNKGIPIDEWDFRKKQFRKGFCKLFPIKHKAEVSGSANKLLETEQKLIKEMKRKFHRILNEREIVRRVSYGEELDLDAMVESYSEVHAGNGMKENIYQNKRKRKLDLAVSFLVDISLSTDAYSQGEKIMDIEKKSLTILGEALNEFSAEFSINCFYSETRNNCTFVSLKSFQEKWQNIKDRISSLNPIGYTRIGPALRYGIKSLANNSKARSKWLILISDGKPTDFDHYEGNYGIQDVRKAIKDAKKNGVRVCGLALDPSTKGYFHLMMGGEPFQILEHPKHLVHCLGKVYGQMLRSL